MSDYEEILNDRYLVKIIKAEICKSKLKQTPYLNLWCKILEGIFVGNYVFKKLWLTEKAMEFTKKELKKLRYEGSIAELGTESVLKDFERITMIVSVKTSDQNGYRSTDVYIVEVKSNYVPKIEEKSDNCVQELMPEDVNKVVAEHFPPEDDIPF